MDEIREGLAAIKARRAGFGRPPTPDLIGINMHSVIAGSDIEADELVTPTIGHMFADADALRDRTLIGSVETFRRRLLEYRDAGVNYVELKPIYRDIDHLVDQLRCIHDEIMPSVAP